MFKQFFLTLVYSFIFNVGYSQDTLLSSSKGKIQDIFLSSDHYLNMLELVKQIEIQNKHKLRTIYFESFYNEPISDKEKCRYLSILDHLSILKHLSIMDSKNNKSYKNLVFKVIEKLEYELIKSDSYEKKMLKKKNLLINKHYLFYNLEKIWKNKVINKSKVDYSIDYEDFIQDTLQVIFRNELLKYANNVIAIKTDVSQKNWLQDEFIIGNNKNKTILYYKDSVSKFYQNILRIDTNFSVTKIPFFLKGGNYISVDSFIFVGKDSKVNKDTIEKYFNKHCIIVGLENFAPFQESDSSYQPEFHLDLFMNVFRPSKKYIILFSKSKNDTVFNYKIDSLKHSISKQFKVINPNLVINFDSIPINILVEGQQRKSYSYSNNIIELNENDSIIYLPYYSAYNERKKVRKVLKEYFSKIVFINGANYNESIFNWIWPKSIMQTFDKSTKERGSLHCLTKVLRRQ